MKLYSRILLGALLGVVSTPVAFAEEIPLKNWTVPQYSLSGLGKAVDATPPRAFIGLPPCRVIDTRGGAPLGGGIFANSEARDYTITGICGLPAGADAVSVNFTVTGSPAAPPGAFILAYPTGNPPSPIVSLLNFQAGQTIANGAIVPLAPFTGEMTVNVSHSTHVIMDINGYFSDSMGTPTNRFELIGNGATVMYLRNDHPSCSDCGLLVETSASSFSTASNSIHGVYDGGAEGSGVKGSSNGQGGFAAAGVYGVRSSGAGTGAGVTGLAGAPSFGVHGINFAAGVGVRGQVTVAGGFGVFFVGGLGGTGTKSFIEPHPVDPALAIRYVSLEGPEAGTYFRGRSKFSRGVARIVVPETFRMVTAEEGLSIQVTPIGEMATVAVQRIGLDEIVVKGSRNVEFFYTVNGVRRGYKNWDPIMSSEIPFRPLTPDDRLPENLSADERARLIANGTYTKDGKVNLETARKLGWDKDWKSGRK